MFPDAQKAIIGCVGVEADCKQVDIAMPYPGYCFVADILNLALEISCVTNHDGLIPKRVVIKIRSDRVNLSLKDFLRIRIVVRLILCPIVLIWKCWQTCKSENELINFMPEISESYSGLGTKLL